MYMYDVKIKKIDALAQEYNLSDTQIKILKFYADPDHKYWNISLCLKEIGLDPHKLSFDKGIEVGIDIDWLFIWKFLRQADDGYPVPIYLGF